MSIVNNIPALDTQRQLKIINFNLAKSINRLSTGLRINNAGDDAAGLAISERLRSQIGMLAQGTINAQDAISVVQVAEGGLDTATQLVQRMKTLSTTAASAAKSDADRSLLQVEIDQITEELGRIADTTAFAGKQLLNGGIAAAVLGEASTVAVDSNSFIGAQSTALVASASLVVQTTSSFSLINTSYQLKVVSGSSAGLYSVQIFSGASTAAEINGGIPLAQVSINAAVYSSLAIITVGAGAAATTIGVVINSQGFDSSVIGKVAYISSTYATLTSSTDNSLYIQIGADTGEVIKTFAPSVRPADIFNKQATRLDTMQQAEGLINLADQALDKINKARAILGAQQNRFENVIRNNDIYHQNLTASESRIRDLDVAAETTNFTKNQILLQSATAFLAQANLVPQSLLQLLR